MVELTKDYVKELFDYRDGNLYWKESGRGRNFGIPAGTIQKDGYRAIMVNGKLYKAHRLIFMYHHDYLTEELDHIDGNRLNNEISNLREATHQENMMNQKKTKFKNGKPTTSIYKGVYWDKCREKWIVMIGINGGQEYLGRYNSEIEAAKSYDRAAIKYYGKFANTNKSIWLSI